MMMRRSTFRKSCEGGADSEAGLPAPGPRRKPTRSYLRKPPSPGQDPGCPRVDRDGGRGGYTY